MKKEDDFTIDEDTEFDEEFLDFEDEERNVKHGKKSWNPHVIFFIAVGVVFLFAIVYLMIWNRGQKSDYDPNDNNTEFDTEPLDYIQPLTTDQLAGKPDDGKTTIYVIGNGPFSDNGDDNYLAKAIADEMDATVVNAGFSESYYSKTYDDGNAKDGLSLYEITKALVTNDYSTLEASSAALSDQEIARINTLKNADFSTADAVFIMYDLNDYLDHRPVYDPGDQSNPHTVFGGITTSVKLIQEKYPYIRIVLLSIPASGKTIDDFYVDGNVQDLGNGTLVDYLGHMANASMENGISFIDTYFGVINVETRDQYLENEYHINEAGAKAIAARIKKLITL